MQKEYNRIEKFFKEKLLYTKSFFFFLRMSGIFLS